MRCYSFQNLCGTETEREVTKECRESSAWAAVCIHVLVRCSHVCLPTLGFCLLCFLGSGIDYPSDCSSWLQRLGLAKSKVGRNSSCGPDKAPSFHCPDAINSAGGEPLLFFVWLHLGISTSLNWYEPWKGEWGRFRGCDEREVMCPCLGVVNIEIRAEFECPEISWERVRMFLWKRWVLLFGVCIFLSTSPPQLGTLSGLFFFFFHMNFHLSASLNASLYPSSPGFSALQWQSESPSQQIVEFKQAVAAGCPTLAPWLAGVLSRITEQCS